VVGGDHVAAGTACGSKEPRSSVGIASAASLGLVLEGASELSPDHHEPANLVRHVLQAEGGH